jgi:presenilin-like A22 family membrane protease
MITLAEGVVDLKTPILFVIPKRRDYSFIKEGFGKISPEPSEPANGEGEGVRAENKSSERAAFIIGMGDLIMPAILVVSANVFIQGTKLGGIINLPALGAMIGSVAGILVLLYFVMSGKPQAGLPPINGGTIIGCLVGWALMGWG